MDFLLRNKIYLLPVVLVALMFGYFFYFSFNFDMFNDDYLLTNNIYESKNIIKIFKLINSSYRNIELFGFILKYDMEFYGKYFMTSIFMSSIFVIFMYVLSWYLNFRFLFTVKNKILQDSGIFLSVFVMFIAINNSLFNLFWYSSFACHIFAEMLLFLMAISYVRLFNSSNFEKMANKSFIYKFLFCLYILILSYLIGMDTESTSLFAILVIFVLVIYLIKKYKKIYFWYFFPLITLFYGLYVQVVVLNPRDYIDKNEFLLDKINHFFVYFFKNLWFGYKYFLIFILGYLIVLFLKYFKKITIVNRKDFNISSLFLLGFFVNLAILVILLRKDMFLYNPFLNPFDYKIANLPRWYTMADVFLGLFVLYFCWFLIKEFKHKKNIKYIIGLLFLVIFSNFVMNNIILIKNSNYYNKYLIKPKHELITKIKNEISINNCYDINANDILILSIGGFGLVNQNDLKIFAKKNIDFRIGMGGSNFVVTTFNKILFYERIDVNKIKFEGTCDLKDKKVKK
jgi:hypothetical protein